MAKTKTQHLLGKILPGSVHQQFKKCGKPNCRCERGERHGPYFYHFVRVNGKLKQRYLKADEVDETLVAIQRRQQAEKQQRAAVREGWQQLRQLRDEVRDTRNHFTI